MIIKNNEDLLRVKCDNVTLDEVGELVASLERELEHSAKLGVPGIGLAAPQIGIAKNIAIVRVNKDINFNLVNCQIAQGYDPAVFRQEGCLSFPGRVEDTIRFQEVHIVNNLIYPHSFVATGLIAVVCQHEIDHFTSKLFIDYLVPKVIQASSKKKVGPNDPCICGSKLKYKKCCYDKCSHKRK